MNHEEFEHADLSARRAAAETQYLEFLRTGSFELGLYELPAGSDDLQKPHGEDEVYVVLSGRGRFFVDGDDVAVGPGSDPVRRTEHRAPVPLDRGGSLDLRGVRTSANVAAEHGLERRPARGCELLPRRDGRHALLRADPRRAHARSHLGGHRPDRRRGGAGAREGRRGPRPGLGPARDTPSGSRAPRPTRSRPPSGAPARWWKGSRGR